MKGNRLIIAALAILGLGGSQSVAAAQRADQTRQAAAVKNGQTTRQIEADHFGGYVGGIMNALHRNTGTPPDVWGRSAACARMVRKNKLRSMGISAQRI